MSGKIPDTEIRKNCDKYVKEKDSSPVLCEEKKKQMQGKKKEANVGKNVCALWEILMKIPRRGCL